MINFVLAPGDKELPDSPRSRPKISAIVCTHNGGHHLIHSLPSLLPSVQTLAEEHYEVLLVDNASSDSTPDVLQKFAGQSPVFRVVRELTPGLSHARNRGIREARAPIIAFIDDDAAASPTWLESYVAAFEALPDAWGAGGPISVRWMSPKLDWWTDGLDEIFNRFDRGPRRHRLRYPKVPIGTNMAYRKSAFDTVGAFEGRFGRTGADMTAGDDGEFALRVQRNGGLCFYEPGARVHHFAYSARMSKSFARRRAEAYGRGRCRIDYQHLGVRRVPHQIVRVFLGVLRIIWRRRLGVEEQLPFIYFWAYFRELFGLSAHLE